MRLLQSVLLGRRAGSVSPSRPDADLGASGSLHQTGPVVAWPGLRCVDCGGTLLAREQSLACPECGEVYPVLRETPCMLTAELRRRMFAGTANDSAAGASGA